MSDNVNLYGRSNIYSNETEINENNIIGEVNMSLSYHIANMMSEDYLYWYRRGLQPIKERTKEVRSDICNKIVENHADEIVSFKNGYFLTQPAFYISRTDDEKIGEKIKRLNEYLYLSGKQEVDNKLADWFHTVGKAVLYVTPTKNKDIPVKCYCLDPRSAYVVYDMTAAHEPLYSVNMTMQNNKTAIADVFTKDKLYRLYIGFKGNLMTTESALVGSSVNIISVEDNKLGMIPMVEYRYNSVNMGSFESVIPLLDAINDVMSNRVDGVEQFIQSLAVAVNCNFDEETTYNDIVKAGMIVLKSIGENKADFKILTQQLNQSETQVLVDYLYQQVLTICGMPSTTKGGTSTSDTGAAVLYRDGWYQADTVARNTEDLFKESNKYFDEIFINILNKAVGLDVHMGEFELQFTRNETSNLLVKTQGALNLKQLGLSPEITLAKSGVSNDPVADVANSRKYIEKMWNIDDENDQLEIIEDTRENA